MANSSTHPEARSPVRKRTGSMRMRARLRSLLASPDFEEKLPEILALPPEKAINPLLSFLCEIDEPIRWRAVRAIGRVVSSLARSRPESARIIMRRLMWSLNDESGGIGWGAPEAMGEIMAESEMLACEYGCILFSYLDENGNPLENDLLERGVLWGIGRLAGARPETARGCVPLVLKELGAADAVKRGMAVWALGFLEPEARAARERLAPLLGDRSELRIFEDGELRTRRVCDLARGLLARLGG